MPRLLSCPFLAPTLAQEAQNSRLRRRRTRNAASGGVRSPQRRWQTIDLKSQRILARSTGLQGSKRK
jgi:hypothetical protein